MGREASVFVDPEDAQSVVFSYPRAFGSSCILQSIRLEIGALAAWAPSSVLPVRSYAASCFPHVFSIPETEILTVSASRTFWEKATILHHEANRPENSDIPARYSRHYYDLYMMSQNSIKYDAFSQLNLLNDVVQFKMKFYPRKWADYPGAQPRSIKLIPPDYRLPSLRKDYQAMKNMIFGTAPDFSEIMSGLQMLEDEIHSI